MSKNKRITQKSLCVTPILSGYYILEYLKIKFYHEKQMLPFINILKFWFFYLIISFSHHKKIRDYLSKNLLHTQMNDQKWINNLFSTTGLSLFFTSTVYWKNPKILTLSLSLSVGVIFDAIIKFIPTNISSIIIFFPYFPTLLSVPYSSSI